MIDEFCDIYEYLIARLNNSPGYELKRSQKNINLINKFMINSKINTTDEIWKYLSFQIVLSDRKNSGIFYITLAKCLCLNSIKQWNERTSEKMFMVSRILRQRGLRNPLESQSRFSEEYLDFLRHKFWNTPRGYILCNEYEGALYNEIKCKECKYNKACKYE